MADLSAETILEYLDGDFRAAWDALAAFPGDVNRGNFMFALHAMIYLEVACRCCNDQTLEKLGLGLKSADSRYFTKLPGKAASPAGFKLPERGTNPANALLYALFDLVRNGQAHQYQPTLVTLKHNQGFHVRVTGAAFGATLAAAAAPSVRQDHLRVGLDADGNVWIDVRTDLLFLDISSVVKSLGLPTRAMQRLEAPAPGKSHYQYPATDLLKAFRENGHQVAALPLSGPVPTHAPQIYAEAFNPKKS